MISIARGKVKNIQRGRYMYSEKTRKLKMTLGIKKHETFYNPGDE